MTMAAKTLSSAERRNKTLATSPAVPWAAKFSLAAFHLILNLYLMFFLPLLLLPVSPWSGLTALMVAGLSNAFWSLIHEAIHDMLHPSRRVNMAAGRMLGIIFGAPFLVLRTSHLLHHKLIRSPL